MKATLLITSLGVCFIASFAGCKKEETPPVPAASTNAADATPSAPQPSVAPNVQGPQDREGMIFQRTLDYIRGRIAANDMQAARNGVATLESQPLTPAQKQALDSLKAQIK